MSDDFEKLNTTGSIFYYDIDDYSDDEFEIRSNSVDT